MRNPTPLLRISLSSLAVAGCSLVLLLPVLAEERAPTSRSPLVPNADFTLGSEAGPDHWTLAGGRGRWVDRSILEVTGGGEDSGAWTNRGVELAPGALYRFAMRARALSGTGTVISGPLFANRDFRGISREWEWRDFVFRVPENGRGQPLRIGQWHHGGTVQFDAIRLTPTWPVFGRLGDLTLGDGESIADGRYRFHGYFSHRGSNFHRTLLRATAGFNSDRWVFAGGSEVIYRFSLPGHALLSGDLRVSVNYHVAGTCLAEASRDLESWHPVASQDAVGEIATGLPETLFPADELHLRLRSAPAERTPSFQINRIDFEAELEGDPPTGNGNTLFVDLPETRSTRDSGIESIAIDGDPSRGEATLSLRMASRPDGAPDPRLEGTIERDGTSPRPLPSLHHTASPEAGIRIDVPLRASGPGHHSVSLKLEHGAPGDVSPLTLSLGFDVADYFRTDYGARLEGLGDETFVWWCDATRKIPPRRAVPTRVSRRVELAAARRDFEAVQLVVHPSGPLEGFHARASALRGPDDAVIPADEIRVLRVAYHRVEHPSDPTGIRGRWPDALPPLDEPVDVPAGENQPLWILVHVPADAAAGDYDGEITLTAKGWSARVPLRLHVWNFSLPERNHLETAFGLSTGDIFRYHGIRSDADRRRVLDLYFRDLSNHRISPYDPTPLDPIRVRWRTDTKPPGVTIDFGAFDRAMARAVETYRFTGFRLGVQGLGGGTFHARHAPRIGPFGESSPEYRALFASYARQLEGHLTEKGWLDLAYVYWFDEPAPRDYDFVRGGMAKLREFAPGLRRMLTEEPVEPLAGAVDIWCPLSANYENGEDLEAAISRGDRFWWYVCTGPRAPYCTLFIDHPATELRVWLWQTWKRKIGGILVWRANYWTSSAAFPETPQNPYEDPMGYVSGYSTPRGVRRHWGNGDGRFIYPPPEAATPGLSGPDPVIAPPVSSIRWEMLREGIEDWEYLYLLRELIEKRKPELSRDEREELEGLLEVPAAISASLTSFTTDPAPIYERRAAVARAIEHLLSE